MSVVKSVSVKGYTFEIIMTADDMYITDIIYKGSYVEPSSEDFSLIINDVGFKAIGEAVVVSNYGE